MKKRGKHTSLDPNIKRSVAWLESLKEVQRVIITRTESCRHKFSPGILRVRHDAPGGFRINGYGGNCISDIFIKTDYTTLVKDKITERFKQQSS